LLWKPGFFAVADLCDHSDNFTTAGIWLCGIIDAGWGTRTLQPQTKKSSNALYIGISINPTGWFAVTNKAYLEKKYNTWLVSVEIPKDLHKAAGKVRFKASLKTDSLTAAKRVELRSVIDRLDYGRFIMTAL
jgi:hypothetical protein